MSLRDALLAELATLPGRHEFHVHALVSAPRKRTDLFPYAKPRPRVYLQEIVILLSEQPTFDGPRVMVSAIEAALYNIPSTSCGILYISKVDSTGQASRPSPTASLVRAFLKYYADPSTRPVQADHLWIQLFARAQPQYLFPNSAEHPGKKPLNDVQLCAWWKRVLSDVTSELRRRRSDVTVRPYYVLPGYNELEATQSLKTPMVYPPVDTSAESAWTYGHPYSQSDVPLPCPPGTEGGRTNLGQFIPSFDDDPKSRFMDEIAHTTNADGVSSPKRKRRKSAGGRPEPPSDDEDVDHGRGELNKVGPEEFWERMSFRQECIAGVVTAFFVVALSSPKRDGEHTTSAPSPLAPQPGQVSSKMVRRVISTLLNHHDFSTRERALRATETLESAIKGLCEDLAAVPSSPKAAVKHVDRPSTPEPGPSHLLEPPRTPPRRTGDAHLPDISPNPFPDPVASLETYHSYIYGSAAVDNPPLPPKAAPAGGQADSAGGDRPGQPQVTVLTVRKKRKAPS
ncbi:histone acetylation protein-domain-containing protein [Fomitopsis serialis]|uniref:histone acetylation protein-domain-containing protein n=1 Tax=Fomitopsis serialis TaxID=139415 RepID=UPI0020087154|nr:histone acetylation protein-domain-containing protein [Neoantrodia serialis]KAH9936677.1 histone acetylation protein-domain-containing protein [Neoantrodia serialis]